MMTGFVTVLGTVVGVSPGSGVEVATFAAAMAWLGLFYALVVLVGTSFHREHNSASAPVKVTAAALFEKLPSHLRTTGVPTNTRVANHAISRVYALPCPSYYF